MADINEFADIFRRWAANVENLHALASTDRQCVMQWQRVSALVTVSGGEQEFVQKLQPVERAQREGIRQDSRPPTATWNATPAPALFVDLSYRLTALLRGR